MGLQRYALLAGFGAEALVSDSSCVLATYSDDDSDDFDSFMLDATATVTDEVDRLIADTVSNCFFDEAHTSAGV